MFRGLIRNVFKTTLENRVKSLQDSLSGALKSVKLGRLADLAQMNAEWASIVGEKLAHICRPAYIRKKTLVIDVFDTSFMEPLEYLRVNILESVVRQTGKEAIESISLRLRQKELPETAADKNRNE
jgi:hypothetical protein